MEGGSRCPEVLVVRRQSRDVQLGRRTWSFPRGLSSLNSQGNSKRKTALASPSNPESPHLPSTVGDSQPISPELRREPLHGMTNNRHTFQRRGKDHSSEPEPRNVDGQCREGRPQTAWPSPGSGADVQHSSHLRCGQRWLSGLEPV